MPGETQLEFYQRWQKLSTPYFQWQYEQFSMFVGKRVADLGCGLGSFVPLLTECEKYVGVESNPEFRLEFQRTHTTKHVSLADCSDACDSRLVNELKAHEIDTIISVNMLEHIKDDRMAFCNMVNAVPVDGYICIIVPAGQFIYGSLDELDNHYRRYNRKSLLALADFLPVNREKIYYFNSLGAVGWFLKSSMLREKKHGNENYEVMNLFLPLIKFAEGLIHPPFGMSLVAIFKKRD